MTVMGTVIFASWLCLTLSNSQDVRKEIRNLMEVEKGLRP